MNNQFGYSQKSQNAAAGAADKGGSLKMTLTRLEVRIEISKTLGYDQGSQ